MAKPIFELPFDSLHGKLGKNSRIIYRQKHIYNASGHAIATGVQEAYMVTNPRDRKKNPPKGAELAHLQRFQQACLLTKKQLNDPLIATQWKQRFEAQLKNADPDAPIDERTGKRKIYTHLHNYVRACILRQLSTQP